jgi:hypothetical protein
MIWRRKPRSESRLAEGVIRREFQQDGVLLSTGRGEALPAEAADLLVQLEDEGFVEHRSDGSLLPWAQMYRLLQEPDYDGAAALLGLPPVGVAAPQLASRGSLIDTDFAVVMSGWVDSARRPLHDAALTGAMLSVRGERELLPHAVWRLVELVRQFSRRSDEQRTEVAQRRAWGEIRKAALEAGALLDTFLLRTVVLTPERLQLALRRSEAAGIRTVEVVPGFEGAPAGWLDQFDRSDRVRDRYDLATPEGVVQVILSDAARTVLSEIKRMPGRRVSGARAEAFLINPVAALGPDAATVIDDAEFASAKEDAGIVFDRFTALVEADASGAIRRLGLVVTSLAGDGAPSGEVLELSDQDAMKFADAVEAKLEGGLPLCGWREFEFELDADSRTECARLRAAVAARAGAQLLIHYDEIYDLTGYSLRVDGIGVEKPIFSPYVARKPDSDGWFPEDIIPMIAWTPEGGGEPVAAPISPAARDELHKKVAEASASGATSVTLVGLPSPIPLAEAQAILSTFDDVYARAATGGFDPRGDPGPGEKSRPVRKGLLIKPNIEHLDYVEDRQSLLIDPGREPQLPATLRHDVQLKEHQRAGVAWLQHLYSLAPKDCRGALLADDMGLGKTLQLLCLIASAREADPSAHPALVVAPLSLLENWKEEVDRFFQPGALKVLTAYGDDLTALRVPRAAIDENLRRDGLVRFLRPGWRGDADIVLTTYETLRDLEFSFAREQWSMLICDEAQKIKTPSARMTTAAKKQNVRFRIACTGTPVENSLTDLWCLFDFVQPGLLGVLNEFGRDYKRPIEAETDEEKAKLEELRALVHPQILRRTKQEVAKDLPRKIIVEGCQALPISTYQRGLYAQAVEVFKQRHRPGAVVPFKNHLGLLHYLRLVCTDPRRIGLDAFVAEPLGAYGGKAPKLDWLIRELRAIQPLGEKVIVFCEFKNIQRLLRHYVEEAFGFAPDIINGDTTASADHVASRQKRIRAFQERPGFGVIILSPVAVGFGVNIQAANHVIHYTRTWNPAKEDQASDRAYRIGQTRDVHVYYPIVAAPDFKTFDVKLDELLTRKRALAGDMLNGSGDVGAADFDLDDIAPEGSGGGDAVVTIDDVLRMNAMVFECFAAALWANQGYTTVLRTPSTKDGGVDIVARNGATGVLVQCKTSTSERSLNWDAIKEVVAGRANYERRHPGTKFALACITNASFNGYAREQAQLNDVALLELQDIERFLSTQPMRFSELERFIG